MSDTDSLHGAAESTQEINAKESRRDLSVIGGIERSGAGNLILRIGRNRWPYAGQGWEQTEHVVLTPEEAARFLGECSEVLTA